METLTIAESLKTLLITRLLMPTPTMKRTNPI